MVILGRTAADTVRTVSAFTSALRRTEQTEGTVYGTWRRRPVSSSTTSTGSARPATNTGWACSVTMSESPRGDTLAHPRVPGAALRMRLCARPPAQRADKVHLDVDVDPQRPPSPLTADPWQSCVSALAAGPQSPLPEFFRRGLSARRRAGRDLSLVLRSSASGVSNNTPRRSATACSPARLAIEHQRVRISALATGAAAPSTADPCRRHRPRWTSTPTSWRWSTGHAV